MPRRVNAGSIVTIATTLIATAATLQAVVEPATATSSGQTAATGCDSAAAGFTPVLQLDLPDKAGYLNETPPYSLDRTAEIGPNFDRVGYCLELNGPDGPQWGPSLTMQGESACRRGPVRSSGSGSASWRCGRTSPA
jgi:hypothetical protein